MISSVLAIVAVGAAAGWTISFLLRAGGTVSRAVVVAGIVGATLAALCRQAMGSYGVVIGFATVLLGAMVVSFAVRLRLFATEAR